MSIAEKVKGALGAQGRPVTLRRFTESYNPTTGENVRTPTNYDTVAVIKDIALRNIVGLLKQGDKEVRIAATALIVEPIAKDDKLVVGGKEYEIIDVRVTYFQTSAVLYTLTIRG